MTAPTTKVLLVAHGSRADEANDAHRQLCRAVAEQSATPVEPAFLELADPSIAEAIDAAVAAGATRVVLVPHFLHPGRHLSRDLPALADEAEQRHAGVTVDITAHSGADPAIVELLAALVARSTDG